MHMNSAERKRGVGSSTGSVRAGALALLVAFCLAYRPAEINTESLTMSTYYPAPFGVYQEMRVTQDTFMAYQGGNVGINVPPPPPGGPSPLVANLHVRGMAGVEDPQTGAMMAMRFRDARNGQNFLEFGRRVGGAWQFEPPLDMIVGPAPAPGGNYMRLNHMYLDCEAVFYTENNRTFCPNRNGQVLSAVMAGPPACGGGFCTGSEERTMTYQFVDNSGRRHNVNYRAFQYPPRTGWLTCCRTLMR